MDYDFLKEFYLANFQVPCRKVHLTIQKGTKEEFSADVDPHILASRSSVFRNIPSVR